MRWFLLIVIFACAASAKAQTFYGEGKGDSGNILMDDCSSEDKMAKYGCVEYIEGIVDGWMFSNANRPSEQICIPQEVIGSQLVKVVLKFGNDHPELLHLRSSEVVVFALSAAFPCPKATK